MKRKPAAEIGARFLVSLWRRFHWSERAVRH